MDQRNQAARVAGVLYLTIVLTGIFNLIYVPGRLIVRGNAAATASNILASPLLFRANMVIALASSVVFLFLGLALYRLLKEVNRPLALLMVVLALIQVPLATVDELAQNAALILLQGPDYLSVFTGPQRQALAMFCLDLNSKGNVASELFWGLWLFPLGLLVFRSGFLPRIIGLWLILNCFAYAAVSFTGMLFPQYLERANKIASPALMGELAFMLWLLIFGARPAPVRKSSDPSS